jgi:hypothetical protein
MSRVHLSLVFPVPQTPCVKMFVLFIVHMPFIFFRWGADAARKVSSPGDDGNATAALVEAKIDTPSPSCRRARTSRMELKSTWVIKQRRQRTDGVPPVCAYCLSHTCTRPLSLWLSLSHAHTCTRYHVRLSCGGGGRSGGGGAGGGAGGTNPPKRRVTHDGFSDDLPIGWSPSIVGGRKRGPAGAYAGGCCQDEHGTTVHHPHHRHSPQPCLRSKTVRTLKFYKILKIH